MISEFWIILCEVKNQIKVSRYTVETQSNKKIIINPGATKNKHLKCKGAGINHNLILILTTEHSITISFVTRNSYPDRKVLKKDVHFLKNI